MCSLASGGTDLILLDLLVPLLWAGGTKKKWQLLNLSQYLNLQATTAQIARSLVTLASSTGFS